MVVKTGRICRIFNGYIICGINTFLQKGSATEHLELRQAFLLTNSAWISIAFFGSLPFLLSDIEMSFIDAFFESTSGITTTGATVIENLETKSYGILIWRALLQWLGGVGIIVMALAVLPMLSIGGMQLFKTESYETPDKVVPKQQALLQELVLFI